MADLQEQLQAILGDPQAMGQITAIAKALTGGGTSNPPPSAPPPPPQDVDYVPVGGSTPSGEESYGVQGGQAEAAPAQDFSFTEGFGAPSTGGPENSGATPAGAPDLSALTSLLGGSMDIDPKLIQLALRVYTEYSAQDNEKAALLAALKPFLRQERLEKMEKAEKVARLSRLVRVAFQLLKEEGGERV